MSKPGKGPLQSDGRRRSRRLLRAALRAGRGRHSEQDKSEVTTASHERTVPMPTAATSALPASSSYFAWRGRIDLYRHRLKGSAPDVTRDNFPTDGTTECWSKVCRASVVNGAALRQ